MLALRPVGRSLLLGRRILLTPTVRSTATLRNSNRSLFTAAAPKKRSSFRSFVARWTLAGGLVYAYTTSNIFADEPRFFQDEPRTMSLEGEERPKSLLPEKGGKSGELQRSDRQLRRGAVEGAGMTPEYGSPGELGDEAEQEGAFNPETGEINWDCPCLGGMAHGPCGEEFKTAFSCFVFSAEDPKGVDCIDKFKDMQKCFQKYPEIYGTDDEDEEEVTKDGTENESQSLEVLDARRPEDTRSLATSPKAPSGTQVGSETAKLGTGPIGTKSKEGAVSEAKKGGQ